MSCVTGYNVIVNKFFYSCMQVAYWKLSVVKEGDMTKGTTLRVVNAMAIPNLTHGCKAEAIQTKHKGEYSGLQR